MKLKDVPPEEIEELKNFSIDYEDLFNHSEPCNSVHIPGGVYRNGKFPHQDEYVVPTLENTPWVAPRPLAIIQKKAISKDALNLFRSFDRM